MAIRWNAVRPSARYVVLFSYDERMVLTILFRQAKLPDLVRTLEDYLGKQQPVALELLDSAFP